MKKLTTLAISLIFAIGIFATAGLVLADNYGLDITAQASGLDKVAPHDVTVIIGNVIGNALSLVSVIFFILMIYGGFRWMLSRGHEEDTKKALDTIVGAFIGIIIVLASYAITNFVFNSLGKGSAVTTPTAGTPTAGTPGLNKDKFCFDGDTCQLVANEKECTGTYGGNFFNTEELCDKDMKLGIDEACMNDNQCDTTKQLYCVQGKCELSATGGIGQSCGTDIECLASEVVCGEKTKKCVLLGGVDSYCQTNADCDGADNLLCKENVCAVGGDETSCLKSGNAHSSCDNLKINDNCSVETTSELFKFGQCDKPIEQDQRCFCIVS